MKRSEQILKLLSEQEKIDVNTLSEKLGVSKVTIRKDLDKLEDKGFLRREHGYAVLNSGDNINVRLSFHYDVKKRIAERAAQLVSENETIIIESGSTCALLAEAICQRRLALTIITNSYFIAEFIKSYDSVKVILLGGEYQKQSQVTVGPLVKEMLDHFRVTYAFVGTDGFDEKLGFTGKDLMRSEVVARMSEVADQTLILTDSSKFKQRGTVSQFGLQAIQRIITDDHIPAGKEALLRKRGILVEKVPFSSEASKEEKD